MFEMGVFVKPPNFFDATKKSRRKAGSMILWGCDLSLLTIISFSNENEHLKKKFNVCNRQKSISFSLVTIPYQNTIN